MVMLRVGCERALWFADSFNIDLLQIVFRSKTTGQPISINYDDKQDAINTPSCSNSNDDNLMLLHQILYVLDRFGVSDEFYHELSMLHPSLPHSYAIKAARKNINAKIKFERLPTPYFGCYRRLHDCIAEAIQAEVIFPLTAFIFNVIGRLSLA